MQLNCGVPNQGSIEDFRRNLRVLEREIVRQLAQETGCCGVTLAQCHALLELSRSESSLSALAAALDLDISTLSRTVDGMVQCGFVARTDDTADRRLVRISLTASGRQKVAVINETCNRYYSELLGGLAEKDQRCIIRAVRLLADLMRRLRAPGRTGCSVVPNAQGQRRPKSRRRVKQDV